MLLLGTLDDKTLEYPFGAVPQNLKLDKSFLLHHCLFSEDLLLEEGFILASAEALNPANEPRIILEAIRNGLFKIASRNGDLFDYVKSRRSMGHLTPPQNAIGNSYIQNLQHACEEADAFVSYGNTKVDFTTFDRFRSFLKGDSLYKTLAQFDIELPQNILARYEDEYSTGNNGKQWTARAAWEHAVKQTFPDQPDVVHALMCEVNRERHLIRGACFAAANDLPVEVETGLLLQRHDLVVGAMPIHPASEETYEMCMPRVPYSGVLRSYERLFRELGDRHSDLFRAKRLFVEKLASAERSGFAPQKRDLEEEAIYYENALYRIIGETPLERNEVVTTVSGIGGALALTPAVNILWSHVLKKGTSWTFAKNLSRRQFLRKSLAFGALTGLMLADTKRGSITSNVLRSVRTATESETGDFLFRPTVSDNTQHQRFAIDRISAANFYKNL
ncbi:hypothetical protein QMT40_001270 [Parvibaculaceae bacterium PLY_AMNH_Bact1]|nr:hypothetical protein QMT40_001270 [Parvibaculaceae bacterium PLY_AMNH_Bact1]